ncbi:MAG: site-2 protease family protein, partial [Clostridia bacterium]|nr:site-2 protease family protein [Clostridia bacterium]
MSTISTLLTILLVIVFFGVMIFLHEFGHFIAARLCRVRVLEFALGMGPKLLSHTSKKSGTVYSLRLLPIGGFCSMLGEDEDDSVKGNAEAFCNRPRYQRFIILVAGAFMNLLTAFLAMCVVLCIQSGYTSNTVQGFYIPSYAGGLEIGDVITAVGDTPVETKEELLEAIDALKNDLARFTVERGGKSVTLPEIGLPQYRKDGEFYRMPDFLVEERDGRETTVSYYTCPSAEGGLITGDVICRVNGRA